MTSNITAMRQAQVFLNNTCELDCHFCMNKYIKQSKSKYQYPDVVDKSSTRHAGYADVIKSIDFLIQSGVRCIELGTTIGEPLQHKMHDLVKIFQYLENHEQIERYFMYTNLLFLTNEHIALFNESEKFNIKISCYGTSKKQYVIQTQHDKFGVFVRNLKMLKSINRNNKMDVLMAFRAPTNRSIEQAGVELIKSILRECEGVNTTYEYTREHFDWKRTVDHSVVKDKIPNSNKSHCGMIHTDCGVLSNGDFTICAWLDVYGNGVLGNIHSNTPNEILQAREKIIHDQNNGIFENICKYCKLYIPNKK